LLIICRRPPTSYLFITFLRDSYLATAGKNEGAKRGDMVLANRCIESDALLGMDTWIGKGSWQNGFGEMFLNFRDAMQRYCLRLSGQNIRQTQAHKLFAPLRSGKNALKMYVKDPRRADKAIHPILRPLNTKPGSALEYEMVDLNDYMGDMSRSQRYMYLLLLQQGMSVPIFHYTWSWGGSRAGVNPHVIWRVPPLSEKQARYDGMNTSQRNIEYLNKNTSIYRHSWAEHTAYMAVVVKNEFVCSIVVAQAIFEFLTGEYLSTSNVNQEDVAAATRYALNFHDIDNIVDMRRLNARPKGNAFDPFWAKMAEFVEGRMNDRRHGDTLYMPVATSISDPIKITVDALQLHHAPKTLEESWIEVPSRTWVTLQFCAKIHCPRVPLTTPAI